MSNLYYVVHGKRKSKVENQWWEYIKVFMRCVCVCMFARKYLLKEGKKIDKTEQKRRIEEAKGEHIHILI